MDTGRSDPTPTSLPIMLSNSSDDRFFTAAAFPGGFLRRSDSITSSDPLREEIRRELEKERIREEIIALEVIRRRELEIEVRRELGLERDLGIGRVDGFSLLGKSGLCSSMWSDQRVSMANRSPGFGGFSVGDRVPVQLQPSLPFQRNPEAAKMAALGRGLGGNQVPVLAKSMNANLGETKRKVVVMSGSTDLTVSGLKKQKHEKWSCALCHVSATCEQGLQEHLNGRKHKSKEAALRSKSEISSDLSSREKAVKPIILIKKDSSPSLENGVKRTVPMLVKKDESPSLEDGIKQEIPMLIKKDANPSLEDSTKQEVPVQNELEDANKGKFRLWCEMCKVGCHSEIVMNHHLRGQKHVGRMQVLEQSNDSVLTTKTLNGSPVQKERDTSPSQKNIIKQEVPMQKKLQKETAMKRKYSFWCEDCKIGCHSESVMNNHVMGKKHVARAKLLEQMNGNVSSSKTPNDSINGTEKDATAEANEDDTGNFNKESTGVKGIERNQEDGGTKVIFANDKVAGREEMQGEQEENVIKMVQFSINDLAE